MRAFGAAPSSVSLSCFDHRGRDLVLDREDVVELAVVGLRPQVRVGAGADQLRGDPHRVARLAHGAFEHVRHVQRARDLRDRDLFALERERRGARVTRSCGTFASRLSSSSEMPSEKYSCSLSSLMLTNGSTAIDLSR